MKILAIGAHPDDIEYGCCGFLLKMKKAGNNIDLLVMSSGEKGITCINNDRRKEQEMAFERCGFYTLFFRNYPDGEMICNSSMVSDIEEAIKESAPDLIITHYPDDYHQDHRNVAQAVIAAARNQKALLFYHSYSAMNFQPEVFARIDSEIEEKIEILKCFQSQIEKNTKKNIDFIHCAVDTNKYYGNKAQVQYAEGFSVAKVLI